MIEAISAIKEVLKRFEQLYEKQELEDLIYDSIIVLSWMQRNPCWRTNKRGFLDFNYEKIITIIGKDVFRNLQEALHDNVIEMDELIPVSYENIVRNQHKEQLSIYYTPQWLVRYIVNNSISKEIESMKSIENIRILEPACGAGMFLIYVFEVLYTWYTNNTDSSNEEIIKKIIQDNLYGIDIDSRALKLCKYTLYMKAIKLVDVDIDVDIEFNLYNDNYLNEEASISRSFNFIIGNPPYLENRRVNKYFDKEDLKKRYITAIGRFDIYSLFIEKSLQLIEEKGIISFVLPGNLLTNNNFLAARELLLRETEILQIINLGEGIFQGVSMNMTIIALRARNSPKLEHKIECKNLSKAKDVHRALWETEYILIPQRYYSNLIKKTFDINSSELTFKLRDKVFDKGCFKINDACEVIAGIATGNVRKKLLTRDSGIPNAKKVLEGKNIECYKHIWQGLYIIDDRSIIDKSKGEYATFMRRKFIEEEKILIRQTADKFICTYDDQGYYLLNTLYSLKIRKDYKDKINIKYVLGLLNSKLYSFLYRSIVGERGKLFPQLKIFHIQNSPIIIPSTASQHYIVERVDRIINLKKHIKPIEYSKANIDDHLIIDINRLINDIDAYVYNLFKLTHEEIREIEKDNIS